MTAWRRRRRKWEQLLSGRGLGERRRTRPPGCCRRSRGGGWRSVEAKRLVPGRRSFGGVIQRRRFSVVRARRDEDFFPDLSRCGSPTRGRAEERVGVPPVRGRPNCALDFPGLIQLVIFPPRERTCIPGGSLVTKLALKRS